MKEDASEALPSRPSRLRTAFEVRRARGQAAFVPFLTHGFPAPADTPRLLARLAEAGADVIELGVPFSDPLADGPTLQRAGWRALEQGVTLERTLALVAEVSGELPPIVIFTYLNPVLRMGVDRFLDRAVEAGAAGLLLTDLPAGAHPALEARLGAGELDRVPLAAPTTAPERVERIARHASGFLYYIARMGVTGAREELAADLPDRVAELRRRVRLPVAVGFGISRPEHAAAVARAADGVVVGSALVAALERDEEEFAELATSLSEATHGGG